MEPLTIPPASIRLTAHEYQITRVDLFRQIHGQVQSLGEERPSIKNYRVCRFFPFCNAHHEHRPWPRKGDFRDHIMAELPRTPPTGDSAVAAIKRMLVHDLEQKRKAYAERAGTLVGEDLACFSRIVTRIQCDLDALPGRTLLEEDIRDYARLEIQARIQRMLDQDVANGTLVASVVSGKQVFLLDNLVNWASSLKIEVKQPPLPGCEHSLVHDSYQRLRQQILAKAMAVAQSHGTPVTSADPRQNRTALDLTRERGARRIVLENWDDVERLHGPGADAHQVLRMLPIHPSEKVPVLKTIQNILIDLRKERLIP